MRILIISDIHGNYNDLKKIISKNEFDKLFILGDVLKGQETEGYNKSKVVELLHKYKDITSIVKGNCDSEEDFKELGFTPEEYLEIEVDDMKFLLTHGHLYNYYNLPNIDFNVYMQGHTHIPVLVELDGKYYLNPGSTSIPLGMYDKSYAIYENHKITIYETSGGPIMEMRIEKEKQQGD